MGDINVSDIPVMAVNALVALVVLGVPVFLTCMNLYNCFAKKPKEEAVYATVTVILGFILYVVCHVILFDEGGDYNVALNWMQVHFVISSQFRWLEIAILAAGAAGYFVLLLWQADRLPPLVSVLSIVCLILMNVFQIFYAVQISKNVESIGYFLYIYHFNILLLSARVIYRQMKEQVVIMQGREKEMENHRMIQWFYRKMSRLSSYTVLIFIALFIVVAILEIIFVLTGQGLDAPVKMFTDTADWTFSKQIPPPPLEYDGHYLCTVAAGGHEKVVKPLRFGHRKGAEIVVNRQLCVANAFEEVIQERLPKFHRWIRHIYDTYGYPLSKKITSPLRADLVYILMKPLEWVFLIFLYLVDVKPEKRISRQYL